MNLDRRLLEQLRRVRWAFLAAVLAGTAVGVAAIAQARFLSRVIARVFLDGYGLNQVMPWMWGLLVVILVRSLFTWIGDLAGAAAARQIKVHIRELLTAKLFRLGPLYSQARPAGELSSIMLQGVEALDAYFSQYLPQIVLAALVPLAVLVLVFPADWLSGLILLVTGPLIPVFMFLIGSTAEQLTRQQFKALGRMSAALLDALQGLRALKELGRSRDYAGRIQEVSEQYRRKTLDVLRVTFLSALALELLGTISTAVIAVQIGLRLLYGRMDFEAAFFLLVIAPDFYLPLRSLGLRFHAALNGVSAARRIFQVLDEEEPAVFQRPSEGVASRHHPDLARKLPEITFKNVKYRYPGSEQAALQGLSFTLRPGEVTALVGESGAGKSTTAAVLLRFISAQGGEVSVGGRSLAEIDPVEWRKLIAWVPQRPHLTQGSLAENLRIANWVSGVEEMRSACRLARLEKWIETLPQGYETQIGEGGMRLSGGQAQRLALARAFIRNAPLLIMDEPTAHLDPPEEALLEEAVRAICRERTSLVIAHRFATIYRAGQIVVLAGGQVAEAGRHEELISRQGTYAQLVQAYGGQA